MAGHFPIVEDHSIKDLQKGKSSGLKTFSPSPWISPYVSRYIIIDCEASRVNRILPDTAVVMSLRLKGNVLSSRNNTTDTIPRLAISGLRKTDRLIKYERGSSNLLVVFKPMGASAFVKEPLNELFEITAPLNTLNGFSDVSELEDQLRDAEDDHGIISVIEDFLLSRLIVAKPDMVVIKAIGEINRQQGNIRIKDLAGQLCISQDPLEKRFRRLTGVSPKQFAHITRMKTVITDVRSNKYQDLGEVIFNAGYFDLPHFHKDFKHFTGQTPSQFFAAPPLW